MLQNIKFNFSNCQYIHWLLKIDCQIAALSVTDISSIHRGLLSMKIMIIIETSMLFER